MDLWSTLAPPWDTVTCDPYAVQSTMAPPWDKGCSTAEPMEQISCAVLWTLTVERLIQHWRAEKAAVHQHRPASHLYITTYSHPHHTRTTHQSNGHRSREADWLTNWTCQSSLDKSPCVSPFHGAAAAAVSSSTDASLWPFWLYHCTTFEPTSNIVKFKPSRNHQTDLTQQIYLYSANYQ